MSVPDDDGSGDGHFLSTGEETLSCRYARRTPHTVKARITHGAPGAVIVFTIDGLQPRAQRVNDRGTAQAEWPATDAGEHHVRARLPDGVALFDFHVGPANHCSGHEFLSVAYGDANEHHRIMASLSGALAGDKAVFFLDGEAPVERRVDRDGSATAEWSGDRALSDDAHAVKVELRCGTTLTMRTGCDTPIDLGDLAVGGDGFGSGPVGVGVRVSDGTLVPEDLFAGVSHGGPYFRPTDGSNGSADLPYVDGVLLANQRTTLSTSGLTFDFPRSNGNQFDAVRNAAAVFDRDAYPPRLQPIRLPDQPNVDRRGLGIHANGAITYDLAALRHDGYCFSVVEGVAGINFDSISTVAHLEVWVIVDGVSLYRKEFKGGVYPRATGGGPIFAAFSVNLPDDARFLTLAITDYDRRDTSDHGVIADAVLRFAQ